MISFSFKPTIVQAWYPGQEGGTAVAEVLFGDYNPGGKLPITFYKSTDQLPDYEEWLRTTLPRWPTRVRISPAAFFMPLQTRKGISFQMKWIMWLPPEILP